MTLEMYSCLEVKTDHQGKQSAKVVDYRVSDKKPMDTEMKGEGEIIKKSWIKDPDLAQRLARNINEKNAEQPKFSIKKKAENKFTNSEKTEELDK